MSCFFCSKLANRRIAILQLLEKQQYSPIYAVWIFFKELFLSLNTGHHCNSLPAIHQLPLQQSRLERLKLKVLLPMLEQANLLSCYADPVLQAQNQLLLQPSIQQHLPLSQSIAALIEGLNQSEQYLRPRRFNRLQRWMGRHLEHQSQQFDYVQGLANTLQQASGLSQQVAAEIAQSEQQIQSMHALRSDMAHFIIAAEQFLQESPEFTPASAAFSQFSMRLAQKINTLLSAQTATDLAILQLQLTHNTAISLLDRFNEAQQLLIPAWQQHLLSVQQQQTPLELQRLNDARQVLIARLSAAIDASSPNRPTQEH